MARALESSPTQASQRPHEDFGQSKEAPIGSPCAASDPAAQADPPSVVINHADPSLEQDPEPAEEGVHASRRHGDDRAMPSSCAAQPSPPQSRRGRARRRKNFWRLKTVEEYERDEHKKEPVRKKYFDFKSLAEIVQLVPYKAGLAGRAYSEEEDRREAFLHFLWGLLRLEPSERWTPTQAAQHPFIMGERSNSLWTPEPEPQLAANFKEMQMPGLPASNSAAASTESVFRLPAEGPFAAGGGGTGVVGQARGGSARTHSEGTSRTSRCCGPLNARDAERGPASAPATSRSAGSTPRQNSSSLPGPLPVGQVATGSAAASVAAALAAKAGAADASVGWSSSSMAGPEQGKEPLAAGHPAGACGSAAVCSAAFWAQQQLSSGALMLPESNPNESYRPPVHKVSEEFLHSVVTAQRLARGEHHHHHGYAPSGSNQARSGAWSVSTAASVCSAPSSATSTPPGGRDRRKNYSPNQPVSPLHGSKYQASLGGASSQESKYNPGCGRAGAGSHHFSASTTTPASSPHGSSASTGMQLVAVSGSLGSTSAQAAPRHVGDRGGAMAMGLRRADGSREGSRGSSPWHLPSPMSELSTASDRLNSSQPSGSDSCGEMAFPHYDGTQCHFDGWEEDPSHSDGHWLPRSALSDSDSATPHSAPDDRASGKDSQQPRWENIPRLSRMQLSRGRLHHGDTNVAQTAGSIGAMGNFREKVGMNDGGPVTPFAPGARRDALNSMMQREPPDGEGVGSAHDSSASGGSGPMAAALAAKKKAPGGPGMLNVPRRRRRGGSHQ